MRPRVLLYHAFGTRTRQQDPHLLFVPTAVFERQMAALSHVMRPQDLNGFLSSVGTRRPSRPSFLVTMDDGYESMMYEAVPVLARHGVPAVMFVPPARVGRTSAWMPMMPDEPLLGVDELREVAGSGIEIGVHGNDHRLMVDLSDVELRRETVEARDAMADMLGRVPRAFAYPEGAFDARAIEAVRRAGYTVGFSVHEEAGRFAVSRLPVNRRDSMVTLAAKLLPGYQPLYRRSRGHPAIRRIAAALARQRR